MAIIVYVFFSFLPVITRVGYYLTISHVMYIPMLLRAIQNEKERKLVKMGITILAIGYFCFTLFGYIYNYINLKNEEKLLQEQLLSLQSEKQELKLEIQKLNDPTYAVRYAKEKFLYSGDGEYVIKLNPIETLTIEESKKDNSILIIIGSVILFSLILIFVRIKNIRSKK